MSGVHIPGMQMPSRCEECFFLRDVGDYVFVGCKLNIGLAKNRAYEHRHNHCPLVPVPDHGRLIDADVLTATIQEEIDGWRAVGCDVSCYESIRDNYILEAPTIIPAGQEGEKQYEI